MAYIGNYKVLTIPTSNFGLDGNAPEIAAGIEAAVRDGMNVINLSLGEPEIQPQRDIVVQAIEAAAAAGVVPVIAAGNEYDDGGRGTVGSPGSAPDAITVAASTESGTGPPDEIASFSSSGPTPVTLQMKPDVTAPGVDVLSSLPGSQWASWSGTSMASPQVAGASAVLMQRHPTWTVQEIKSALESTGDPVHVAGSTAEVLTTREGGGRVDLARADNPLLFTSPTGLSFGLVTVGQVTALPLQVSDAGGGPAPWTVTVQPQSAPSGVLVSPETSTVVAGTSVLIAVSTSPVAAEGDATGFVVLTRGTDVRRVPYWFHVENAEARRRAVQDDCARGDLHRQHARQAVARVELSLPRPFDGRSVPDRSRRPRAGLPLHAHAAGRQLRCRGPVTRSRRAGLAAARHRCRREPLDRQHRSPDGSQPVLELRATEPVVGAALPTPGVYSFVFDTPSGARPGAFTFRFWTNDITPPKAKLLTRSVTQTQPVRLAVSDSGSGVDPASIAVSIDGILSDYHFKSGVLTLPPSHLSRGTHRLRLSVADYQETKNMEDVLGGSTPNTRVYATTFVVR